MWTGVVRYGDRPIAPDTVDGAKLGQWSGAMAENRFFGASNLYTNIARWSDQVWARGTLTTAGSPRSGPGPSWPGR